MLFLSSCHASPPPPCLTPDFRLRVLGPDGTPVTAILVDQHPPGVWDVVTICDDVTSEGDVFRVFPGPHIDRALPLSVGAHGLGAISVPIPPLTIEEVTVSFQEPGTLDIIATGMHGGPGEYLVRVAATGDGPSDGIFEGTLHVEDGLAEFPLQPGEYDVRIWRHRLGWEPLIAQRVTVKSGLNLLPIDLPMSHDLTIRLPGAAGDNWLSAYAPNGIPILEDREDPDSFEFLGLPPGTYTFVLHGDAPDEAMTVRVPTARVIEFRPTRIDAIRVLVLQGDDHLPAAGLVDGDLIVEIDGRVVSSWSAALHLVRGVAPRPTVGIAVLRAGERLTLQVPGALLEEGVERLELTPTVR